MIPVSDSVRSRSTPYVNIAFIGINVLVFLYQLTLSTVQPFGQLSELNRFFFDWGAIPACLGDQFSFEPDVPPRLLTAVCDENRVLASPFTSMFMHGGWLHLIGNMIFLWVFGDNVEDSMGHFRYAIFYVVAGLAASSAHVFMNQNDIIPAIGASGAVSGVLGAYLVLFPRARVSAFVPLFIILWPLRIPAVVLIGFWFLLQLFNGVATLSATDVVGAGGGVAWFAHIGGFIAGIALVRVFTIRRRRLRVMSTY